ncbi:MAG: hypothetical protein QNI85_17365 [Desulfobacterales bacterium]|nr:hypothetical protein [Desulfobacterales bacterium]MDJ0991792.1 hypothetical protein [Desulfobacterales bacterium]
MFIPSYQIHNILKDFTLQLKKKRQGLPPQADIPIPPPTPSMGPDPLRLTSVVTKVADNIMHRIANLGREDGDMPTASETPSRIPNGGSKSHSPAFDYHLMDRNGDKLRKRLVVRDSRSLVERFQHLTAPDETTGDDSA